MLLALTNMIYKIMVDGYSLQLITKAVIAAVRAPDDGCQHPKRVVLPTEM